MPNNYLNFDADDKNGPLKQLVRYYSEIFLSENKLDKNNQTQVIKFAKETINNYSTYSDDTELNKLYDIFSFRPHEFNKINNYNSDLFEFKNWIIKQDFDFRNGSKALQTIIKNNYKSVDKQKIDIGQGYYLIDNYIYINTYKVAIEIEKSENVENGFSTIFEYIRQKKADFGIMIVTYSNLGKSGICGPLALSILDKRAETFSLKNNPVELFILIRKIDCCYFLIKDYWL